MTDSARYGPGDLDDLCASVQGDLSRRLNEHDGSMVTKFLTITEIIAADGERQVVILAQPDLQAHESLGFLEYARAIEWAAIAVDNGRQDED